MQIYNTLEIIDEHIINRLENILHVKDEGILEGWAGFRNVLVHEYVNIDHRIAYAAIRNELDDLADFRAWALGKIELP